MEKIRPSTTNQCKNCVRDAECKTKKGSHQYCFRPAKKTPKNNLEELKKSSRSKKISLFNICNRCGRPLKTPASKLRGYGLICFKKQIEKERLSSRIPLFIWMEEKKIWVMNRRRC